MDAGAYVACHPDIEMEGQSRGMFSSFFSGEGLFHIRATNTGSQAQQIVLSSPGEVQEVDVGPGEDLTVDGDFAIARDITVSMTSKMLGKSFFNQLTGGEGLVNVFSGKGRVWLAPYPSIHEQQMRDIRKLHTATQRACRESSSRDNAE